jgi:hypothetical protein
MCLCTSQQKLLCLDRAPPQHVGCAAGAWQRQWVGCHRSVHAAHTPSDIPTHASDHVHSNLSSAPRAAHHASLINVHTQTHIHNVRVAVSSRLTLCEQQHNHNHTCDVSWQTHHCAVIVHVRTCLVVQLSLLAVSCRCFLLNAWSAAAHNKLVDLYFSPVFLRFVVLCGAALAPLRLCAHTRTHACRAHTVAPTRAPWRSCNPLVEFTTSAGLRQLPASMGKCCTLV